MILVFTGLVVLLSAQWGLVAIAIGITFREMVWTLLTVKILGRSKVSILYSEVLFAIAPSLLASVVTIAIVILIYASLLDPLGKADFFSLALTGVVGLFVYGIALVTLMLFGRSHIPLASTRELVREFGMSLRSKLSRRWADRGRPA